MYLSKKTIIVVAVDIIYAITAIFTFNFVSNYLREKDIRDQQSERTVPSLLTLANPGIAAKAAYAYLSGNIEDYATKY